MVTRRIRLETINDVKSFNTKAIHCPYELDLISGRYKIDGKSIMGIFSLDLSQPIELHLYCEENDPVVKEFDEFAV